MQLGAEIPNRWDGVGPLKAEFRPSDVVNYFVG
jgi:hypothetical protein